MQSKNRILVVDDAPWMRKLVPVWVGSNTEPRGSDPAVGLGMRFVELDAETIHTLEEFVFENSRPASAFAGGAV